MHAEFLDDLHFLSIKLLLAVYSQLFSTLSSVTKAPPFLSEHIGVKPFIHLSLLQLTDFAGLQMVGPAVTAQVYPATSGECIGIATLAFHITSPILSG